MASRMAAAGIAAALLAGGCAADRTAALAPPSAAPRITGPARVAEADHAALLRAGGGEVRAPALARYLGGVLASLAGPADREAGAAFDVTVLDSPAVNAFALPSGRLYLTRGLLALAGDEAELAAVMAHEMAHVSLRHADKRGEREAAVDLVGAVERNLLGGRSPTAARDRSRESLARFSREQEFEADAVGIRTVAAAGYDPGAAARFLRRLAAAGRANGGGGSEMGATHPANAARIAQAVRIAGTTERSGERSDGRARYLAAVEGLVYGDNPSDGLVRGRRFVHPRLGVQFEAPPGLRLENTPRAVLGASADDGRRLLFDAVDGRGTDLSGLLADSWADPLDPAGIRPTVVNGHEAAVATAAGGEWFFRLAAIRLGETTYRLILAERRPGPEGESAFEAALASVAAVTAAEAAEIRPQRIALVTAAPGDTAASLAGRPGSVAGPDLLRLLNGLAPGEAPVPGRLYKTVVD